jgi:hypothetical protein
MKYRWSIPLAAAGLSKGQPFAHCDSEDPPAPVPVTHFPTPAAVPSLPGDS